MVMVDCNPISSKNRCDSSMFSQGNSEKKSEWVNLEPTNFILKMELHWGENVL